MIPKKHHTYFSIALEGEEGQFQLNIKIIPQIVESNCQTHGKTYLITSDQSTSAKELVWCFRQQ